MVNTNNIHLGIAPSSSSILGSIAVNDMECLHCRVSLQGHKNIKKKYVFLILDEQHTLVDIGHKNVVHCVEILDLAFSRCV